MKHWNERRKETRPHRYHVSAIGNLGFHASQPAIVSTPYRTFFDSVVAQAVPHAIASSWIDSYSQLAVHLLLNQPDFVFERIGWFDNEAILPCCCHGALGSSASGMLHLAAEVFFSGSSNLTILQLRSPIQLVSAACMPLSLF